MMSVQQKLFLLKLGCRFGVNLSYTSKKVKICDFESQKCKIFGFRGADLEQIPRTRLKKWNFDGFVRKSDFPVFTSPQISSIEIDLENSK